MKKIFLIIGLILVVGLIISGCSAGEISKSSICNNQKSECLQRCDQKIVGYFCENDCQESYDICMGG